MSKTLPALHDPASALLHRRHSEPDGKKRQRRHALSLRASGPAWGLPRAPVTPPKRSGGRRTSLLWFCPPPVQHATRGNGSSAT
jgi:hypothetical protein